MNGRTLFGLLGIVVVTMVLWAAGAGTASAQICEFACEPPPCTISFGDSTFPCTPMPPTCLDRTEDGTCTSEIAIFTPEADTWTYLFDPNNAIKIGTDVSVPFLLKVDLRNITQADYAARRDNSQFADTVCNPSSLVPGQCVFYRVHGETVPRAAYGAAVDYKIFWNFPPMQGNKHDWMLLRAPCEEFTGDPTICTDTQLFSEEITNFVDRKPPVGTDPVVGGDADGMSDYIVAISTKHPHKGINR